MATFPENLRKLRTEKKMTQQELAQKIGIAKSTVSMYERGEREPDFRTLKAFADVFAVPQSFLLEEQNSFYHPQILPISYKKIPLLGNIACGDPITAVEEIEEYVQVDGSVQADFAVRAVGDSMIGAHIYDGDLVFVKQQDIVENGEIAVVLIEEDVTLKRFKRVDNLVILSPENGSYEDLVIHLDETTSIRILGKVVAFLTRPH